MKIPNLILAVCTLCFAACAGTPKKSDCCAQACSSKKKDACCAEGCSSSKPCPDKAKKSAKKKS